MSTGGWIVLGAAVGGLVGAFGAMLGSAIERAARSRAELAAAGAAWLTAVDDVAQLAQMHATFDAPATTSPGRFLDWLTDQIENTIGKGRVELLRVLVQRPLMNDLQRSTARARETMWKLVLIAPPGLVEEIAEPVLVLGKWLTNPTDAELQTTWEGEGRGTVLRALRRHTRPRWRRLISRRQ